MRVLGAVVKKLRIIVLVTSCALLGSVQQGCEFPDAPSCSTGGGSCNPNLNDDPRCCFGCIANRDPTGPSIGGRCRPG